MRALALGTVALVVSATVPLAPAAGAAERLHVFRVTGTGAGRVEVWASAYTDDGFLLAARVGGGPGRALRSVHAAEFGARTAPRAYAAGVTPDPCAATGCELTQLTAEVVHYGVHDALAKGETIEIAVVADDVEIAAGGSWRVRRQPPARLVRRTGAEADAVGVQARGTAYEAFRSATATGGAAGSVVFAALPCDVEGTGSARLTGGPVTRTLRCDRTGPRTVTAFTTRASAWSLAGDARGSYRVRTRLLVLSL